MQHPSESRITKQIEEMKQGEHACLIYDDHESQMAAVLPFIKSGLERNEFCLYIANDLSMDAVKQIFTNHGINVKRELSRGSLMFSENNMEAGKFDPSQMVTGLRNLSEAAKNKGFSGCRATGEMTWVLGTGCSCNQLVQYEALLNETFPAQLVGICQYNRTQFESDVIRDILRTHSVVILGDRICRNLYCQSQEILDNGGKSDSGVSWMIENLLKFQTVEEGLRQMIQVRDDFFSIVSHELKTPLTELKLQSQLQSRKAQVSTEEWKRASLNNLHSVNHIIGIIESVLDATKISKDIVMKLNLRDEVDLVRLVQESLSQVSEDIKFSLDCPASVIGKWDPLRLTQVISNLLSNAIKYGKNNPIEINISSDDDYAYLAIRDHGVGIQPADQKRIFQLYERAISYTHISGLGIGLFIVDQIVRGHQGKIEVESELGKGSTFTLKLPLRGPADLEGTGNEDHLKYAA